MGAGCGIFDICEDGVLNFGKRYGLIIWPGEGLGNGKRDGFLLLEL